MAQRTKSQIINSLIVLPKSLAQGIESGKNALTYLKQDSKNIFYLKAKEMC
jgi:hypothetical protein